MPVDKKSADVIPRELVVLYVAGAYMDSNFTNTEVDGDGGSMVHIEVKRETTT